jgi:hypothetical protein
MQQETLMLATRPAAPATTVIGYTIVDSPLGRLLVAATVRGICAVRLGDSDARLEAELRREHPEAQLQRDGAPLAPWVNALLRHLAGEPLHLAMPLDVQASAFQRRVWSELRAIPTARLAATVRSRARSDDRAPSVPWPGRAPPIRWLSPSPVTA